MPTDSEASSPLISSKRKNLTASPEPAKRRKQKERSKRSRSRDRDAGNRRSKRSRSKDRTKSHRYHDQESSEEEFSTSSEEHRHSKRKNPRYRTKYPKQDDVQIGNRFGDLPAEKSREKEAESDSTVAKLVVAPRDRKTVDLLTSRTGGAYIPPAKLRLMQELITDKNSAAYQRIAWEALKKSIQGFVNKVNTSNIGFIARELLQEDIIRGRGLLCKSIIQAQAASPTFTNVYAALVAVINSKFPNIGELLLKRLVLQFKRGYKQNNKVICTSATTFIAHLVNQMVAYEILVLQILLLLVNTPTDDFVEVAVSLLKECGQKLTEVSPKGISAIFETLRDILHDGKLEQRIQYMIEIIFQIRKDGFKNHAAVIEELDLVDEEEQITHHITLDDVKQAQAEEILNVFKFDDKYEGNEGKYKTLSKKILDQNTDSEAESGECSEDEDCDEETKNVLNIIDNTESTKVLKQTIYLTIQSSLDVGESAYKLMKMQLKPCQKIELCHMFLDCCAEQRTYEKFFVLLAQRFCRVNQIYVYTFQQIFKDTYAATHRLDTNKLRNVSKFFAHLLLTDTISWKVLGVIKLNEEDSNSSNRIFIKHLFLELAAYMGIEKLNTRLKDRTLGRHTAGLFPRGDPEKTRYSINFFTVIGLGRLTAELREHLKSSKAPLLYLNAGHSSSDSYSDSSSSASESSSSHEEEKMKRKNKRDNVRRDHCDRHD